MLIQPIQQARHSSRTESRCTAFPEIAGIVTKCQNPEQYPHIKYRTHKRTTVTRVTLKSYFTRRRALEPSTNAIGLSTNTVGLRVRAAYQVAHETGCAGCDAPLAETKRD